MPDAEYYRKYRQKNRTKRREQERKRSAARYAEKRIWIASLKSAVGCQSCGERFHGALDLHHRDPELKGLTKSRWRAGGSAWMLGAEDRVFAELAKCIVLCCTCHRKAHAGLVDVETIPTVNFRAISETMALLDEVPSMYEGRVGAKRKAE
jgi:hypothetical protein